MPHYLEIAPSAPLASAVECLWASEAHSGIHRVVPDGCADLVYTRTAATSTLQFVGPMTRFLDVKHAPGTVAVGVRFRPGMWRSIVQLCGMEAADMLRPLDDLWGSSANRLHARLDDAENLDQLRQHFAGALCPATQRSAVQDAIRRLEAFHGRLNLGELAHGAGISPRQFRRRCLELTGLSPKLLSRILRFRHADTLAREHRNMAEVAAECGYSDQSHMNREFQRFAGRLPIRKVQTSTFGSG